MIGRFKRAKLNPNSFTFFFFLLVSAVFWFFNALSNDYVSIIKVPVKFINFPENKLVVEDFVDHVNVKVVANGYLFLKYKSGTFNEAVINLQVHSIYKVSESDEKRFYLLTSTIKNEIATLFEGKTEIKSISPDSIVFDLDEVIKKKVPVFRNFSVNYRKQFMLKNKIIINPDSIFIRGVQSVLDTINSVYTIKKVFNDVHDSLNFDIGLNKITGVEFSNNSVKCNISVEEFAELNFILPINVVNQPDGFNLKLFPSEAKVICNVGFSEYRQVFKQQFSFTANYNDIKDNPERIKIYLEKSPENISSMRHYPISVEYLVEEND